MNFLKTIAIAFSIMAIPYTVSAQQEDTTRNIRNVQIEREYTPEVMQVERPNINMSIEEIKIQKSNPMFSKYNSLYQTPQTPLITIQPAEYGALNRIEDNKGFLRVGAGFLFNWLADFWYPVWNSEEGYFDIRLHHSGFYTLRRNGQNSKQLLDTDLGITFHKNFGNNQLYLSAKYANESFNYYGYLAEYPIENDIKFDSVFSQRQSFNKADFSIGMRTKKRDDREWLWDASLNYKLLNTRNHLTEHNINAIATIDKLLGDNAFVAEAGVQTYFYSHRDSIERRIRPIPYGIDQEEWKTNLILYARPAFLWNIDNIRIRLGANLFSSFGKKSFIGISPDVKIDYLVKDFLNLYAGIGGNYEANSLWSITEENRYYNLSGAMKNTYTPFDVFAGLKVKIIKGMMFDASVSYKYVFNEIFYKNNAMIERGANVDTTYNRYFSAEYNDGGKFEAKARLTYNIKERANIYASMIFSKWSLKQDPANLGVFLPWHTPEWAVNTGADFQIGNGFFGNVAFYFLSKTKAELVADIVPEGIANTYNEQVIVTLPATYDLNLGLGYNINPNLSLFGKFNNILALSSKLNAEPWLGYRTMGFNALIGITAKF